MDTYSVLVTMLETPLTYLFQIRILRMIYLIYFSNIADRKLSYRTARGRARQGRAGQGRADNTCNLQNVKMSVHETMCKRTPFLMCFPMKY